MCIIVDANVAGLMFGSASPPSHFVRVREWLEKPTKNGCLILGGKLSEELIRTSAARRYVAGLIRAGRALVIPRNIVEKEEAWVLASGHCVSDDPHVIGLARASGARTLLSNDQALHADFKNSRLIARPKGAVYQTLAHLSLLKHTNSCGRS